MTETQTGASGTSEGTRQAAGEVAETAKQEAAGVASAGTQGVQQVAATAKQEAAGVVQDATTQARRVVSEATSQLQQQGDEQLQRLAGTVGDLSDELRRMSQAGGDGPATGLAAGAADLLDRLGGRLVEGGLQGTVDELKRFARNRPGLFLAAAAGAGLVAGRVVRNVDRGAITSGSDNGSSPSQDPALVSGPLSSTGALPGATPYQGRA